MGVIGEERRQALHKEVRRFKASSVHIKDNGGKADEQIQHSPSDYQRGTGSLP